MSGQQRVSAISWQWTLLLSMVLPAWLNMNGYAPQKAFVSFDLIIAGGGFLLSGILLCFVALPKAGPTPSGIDPSRTVEWQMALAGPLISLGALIVGLGGALLILPDDPRTTKMTWAIFGLLMLAVVAIIMVRAWRIFLDRPKE